MKIKKGERLPRILKINWIEKSNLRISVLCNTGENRILDYKHILKNVWKVIKTDPDYKLLDPEVFAKAKCDGRTLVWDDVKIWFKGMDGKMRLEYYDVGPDTLYDLSTPDESLNFSIGAMVKKARLAAHLTQDEVAQKAGTSRTYITKLENDKQDIEVMTLKKIVEAGLGKRLQISIK